MTSKLSERYSAIQDRIQKACSECGRDPSEILLVAVSKTKPDRDLNSLIDEGHLHFGENRAKALEKRMESVPDDRVQWHFIGTLQSNKIKYIAHRVNWIQSVHKKSALKEIEKRAGGFNRKINALIQVNISDEDQKSGCDPADLEEILEYAQKLKFTKVCGLMGMATFTDDPEIVRPEFRILKEIFDDHQHLNGGAVDLKNLSMGMTNDLEVAIQEGSTMVRVGTALFGEREY